MNIYDALIIGCGYASAGYAAANKNTIICEKHQICDTNFYLPLSSFLYIPYTPKTKEGECLKKEFDDLSVFSGKMQNTNAFECAFCKYLIQNPLDILLKCRVINTEKNFDGVFDVTIQTNEGLTHILARKILDSGSLERQNFITVLFTSTDFENDKEILLSAFKNSKIEKAFYKDRYAIHIYLKDTDENTAKCLIYQKWCNLKISAKILAIAPIFHSAENKENPLCDANYKNPIEAFENGYFFAKEEIL